MRTEGHKMRPTHVLVIRRKFWAKVQVGEQHLISWHLPSSYYCNTQHHTQYSSPLCKSVSLAVSFKSKSMSKDRFQRYNGGNAPNRNIFHWFQNVSCCETYFRFSTPTTSPAKKFQHPQQVSPSSGPDQDSCPWPTSLSVLCRSWVCLLLQVPGLFSPDQKRQGTAVKPAICLLLNKLFNGHRSPTNRYWIRSSKILYIRQSQCPRAWQILLLRSTNWWSIFDDPHIWFQIMHTTSSSFFVSNSNPSPHLPRRSFSTHPWPLPLPFLQYLYYGAVSKKHDNGISIQPSSTATTSTDRVPEVHRGPGLPFCCTVNAGITEPAQALETQAPARSENG
jgi:hypothetical protein